jgi:hypothetical protein
MIFFLSLLFVAVVQVSSHAYLADPPARSTCWRNFPQCPQWVDDNQMNCGGLYEMRSLIPILFMLYFCLTGTFYQWSSNGGKCGICGEAWDRPKMFERGGSMYRGLIVRHFRESEQFDAVYSISANHAGYVEFRVCNMDGRNREADHECLNRVLLTDQTGRITRFPVLSGQLGPTRARIMFPSGFRCDHCVFQVILENLEMN